METIMHMHIRHTMVFNVKFLHEQNKHVYLVFLLSKSWFEFCCRRMKIVWRFWMAQRWYQFWTSNQIATLQIVQLQPYAPLSCFMLLGVHFQQELHLITMHLHGFIQILFSWQLMLVAIMHLQLNLEVCKKKFRWLWWFSVEILKSLV